MIQNPKRIHKKKKKKQHTLWHIRISSNSDMSLHAFDTRGRWSHLMQTAEKSCSVEKAIPSLMSAKPRDKQPPPPLFNKFSEDRRSESVVCLEQSGPGDCPREIAVYIGARWCSLNCVPAYWWLLARWLWKIVWQHRLKTAVSVLSFFLSTLSSRPRSLGSEGPPRRTPKRNIHVEPQRNPNGQQSPADSRQ